MATTSLKSVLLASLEVLRRMYGNHFFKIGDFGIIVSYKKDVSFGSF